MATYPPREERPWELLPDPGRYSSSSSARPWFGPLVDDPGLQEGKAVLPQFGYVALGMGAMLPAAIFIILVARTPGLVPRWLSVVSYPLATLVAFTAVLFMPLFLFIAWVAAVTVTQRATARRGVRGSAG